MLLYIVYENCKLKKKKSWFHVFDIKHMDKSNVLMVQGNLI